MIAGFREALIGLSPALLNGVAGVLWILCYTWRDWLCGVEQRHPACSETTRGLAYLAVTTAEGDRLSRESGAWIAESISPSRALDTQRLLAGQTQLAYVAYDCTPEHHLERR